MTKRAVIRKLENLSPRDFAKVAPFLEADLDVLNDLEAMLDEVAAGRRSAASEPILSNREVYSRVRKKLSRG